MNDDDRDYHVVRARQELDDAYRAVGRDAAMAHLTLFSLHLDKARLIGRRRADAAASGAGVKIAQIMRVDEQRDTSDIRPMPMAMRGAGGAGMAIQAAVPVEGGQIEIRSRVTLTVRIE